MTVKEIMLRYSNSIRMALNALDAEIISLDHVGYRWDDHTDDQSTLDYLTKVFTSKLEKEIECVLQELSTASTTRCLRFTLPGVSLPDVRVVITQNSGTSEPGKKSPKNGGFASSRS